MCCFNCFHFASLSTRHCSWKCTQKSRYCMKLYRMSYATTDSPWGVGTTCDDITKHQEQENNKKEQYSRCQIWVKEFIQNKTQQDVQFDRFHVTSSRDRAIRATFLESVVARITTHLKHCHATKFCCCKLKKVVEKSRRQFNMLLQLATTKFCCVTMSEVGATTLFNLQRNNILYCKLQQFVARITSPGHFTCLQVVVVGCCI